MTWSTVVGTFYNKMMIRLTPSKYDELHMNNNDSLITFCPSLLILKMKNIKQRFHKTKQLRTTIASYISLYLIHTTNANAIPLERTYDSGDGT